MAQGHIFRPELRSPESEMGTVMPLREAHLHFAVHCQARWLRVPTAMKFREANVAGRILHLQQVFWALPGVMMGLGSQLERNSF